MYLSFSSVAVVVMLAVFFRLVPARGDDSTFLASLPMLASLIVVEEKGASTQMKQ